LWDHDLPCPPVVCAVTHKGKRIEAVAQPTKTGYIFVFDRLTGKPLFDVKEVPTQPSDLNGEQAWPTQPIPVKPPALSPTVVTEFTNISAESRAFILEKAKTLRYGKEFTPPSVEGTLMAPGFHGGATWSGASVDPETGILYINTNNVPCVYKMKKNASGGYDFQGYDFFSDQNGRPGVKPPWGHLTAVNLNTGKFAWRNVFGEYPDLKAKGMKPTGTQNFGGTIVTAGGLVFVGATMDEKFRAYDKANGRLLWEYQLPAGGYATPSTYMVNGKQFVVIACGGGGKLGTKSGDSFMAFALE
ncbi:MAG TPA: PQQ-binding-like beta-propeller repeat protein, partial [Fimbriimonas sp.]|nr:PQQ-binding-like beta-propeller repeat protein [Fimbriimonas sp.]